MPFATRGYYASAWYGDSPWRYRAVVTRTCPPDIVVASGLNHPRLDVVAFIVDRFIGAQAQALAAPWLGAGVERWDGRIEEWGTGTPCDLLGIGRDLRRRYVWTFSGNRYLNPRAALHAMVDGDRSVGTHTYRPPLVIAEASLKLGWHF